MKRVFLSITNLDENLDEQEIQQAAGQHNHIMVMFITTECNKLHKKWNDISKRVNRLEVFCYYY